MISTRPPPSLPPPLLSLYKHVFQLVQHKNTIRRFLSANAEFVQGHPIVPKVTSLVISSAVNQCF